MYEAFGGVWGEFFSIFWENLGNDKNFEGENLNSLNFPNFNPNFAI